MPKVKFLFLAALIALSVGVTGALAADSWDATGTTIPGALVWDAATAAAVDATNNGTTTWNSGYAIKSVEGVSGAATAIDRWTTTSVPVVGTVAPAGLYTFDFTITAPPISSLAYTLPVTPTSVVTVAPFDCNWILDNGSPITTDTAADTVSVLRFSDGAWATSWIEECAGRVPAIVGGFGDGTYRPSVVVDRASMAVFMQRAMELPLANYTGGFSDVPVGYWADDYIKSCVDGGIVGGFGDGTYRPALTVDRGAMSVFVARGMAGGESGVPSGPGTATFDDVPTSFWAFKYVEYAVANGVVGGYGDGTYRPTTPVDRGQMAVFVYRAAMVPSGAVVVLGGPAVTAVDTSTASYDGWSTAAVGLDAAPGDAYVAFDAVIAPSADIDVTFELRDAATPTTAATGAYTTNVTITAGDVATAKAAAAVSGNPYLYATWDIPAGLDLGDYILVVTVNGSELARKPAFTIATTG